MKNLNIVDLMCKGFEGYESDINSIINTNEEYKEAEEIFYKHLDEIKKSHSFSFMSEIEESMTTMEVVMRDTAYNEGFKLGIQFMLKQLDLPQIKA